MEMIMRPKNPQYFNDFQYFSIIFNIGVLWFLSYLFPLVPRSRSALFVHGTSPAGRVEWEESDMNGEEPRNTLETERKFDGFYNRKIPKDI
jgi:hypothetical protein